MKVVKTVLISLLLIKSIFVNGQLITYRSIPYTHSPLHALRGSNEFVGNKDSVALFYFEKVDGRIRSITYRLGNKYKPNYENYTSSDFVWASQNYFEYTDNGFLIRHYDHLSKPIVDNPALSKYEVDSIGRVVRLTFFNVKNEPADLNGIHEYQWKYFETAVGEVRYSIDKEVRPVNNWFPFNWVLMNFDELGNLQTLLTTGANWKSMKKATRVDFIVNKNKIVKWETRDNISDKRIINPGPGISEVRHDFDEYGYLKRTRFFDTAGNRVESKWGHMGFVRTYHANGNRLTYNFIDELDSITVSSRAYSGQRFVWDDSGMYRLKTYYTDAQGRMIFRASSGYAQIQYLYDHSGSECGIIYRDEVDNILCTNEHMSFIEAERLDGSLDRIKLCN